MSFYRAHPAAARTTLLNLIANLSPLQEGSIRLHGVTGHEVIEKNLYSIIFQEITLLDWLSVKKEYRAASEPESPVTLYRFDRHYGAGGFCWNIEISTPRSFQGA